MKKAAQNYIVFACLFLLALFQALSGFVLWFVLPRGSGGGGHGSAEITEHATFWWERAAWIDIHNWVAVALLSLLIIHLTLNWKWILYRTKAYLGQN